MDIALEKGYSDTKQMATYEASQFEVCFSRAVTH